ncbi:FtsX-like permease family protein [Streptomyces sp. NPDC003077]|uniref:FtsX-like permease family protein n=1 Tax=Streptomyces sp. NPDC003077 TaxID=3154443 RepID=UPI0033BEED6F
MTTVPSSPLLGRTGGRLRLALAIGRRAGRGAGGGVHRASLVCAAVLSLLTVWFLAAAHTVHQNRDDRMTARNPVPVAQGSPVSQGDASAVARWWERPDTVGERGATVVYVRPLVTGAPPPPGLPRWPAPGESYLSPALLAAQPGISDRYGKLAGTIRQDGLADAAELVVYVNPRRPDFFRAVDEPTSYIRGFGNPDRQMFFVGSHQFDRDIAELDVLIALMAALPCAALVLVAVRSRAETRDQRLAVLDALGAPASTRALVLVGEAWAPVAAGTLAACAALAGLSLTSPTLPFTGYQVWSRDLLSAVPLLPLLGLGVSVGLLGLTVLAGVRRPPYGGTRPTRRRGYSARRPLVLFAAGLAVAAWGAEYRGVAGRLGFVTGSVVALLALPYASAALARLLGRLLARTGNRAGDPVRIVAGRWLAARPAALARLSAALVVGLGVVTLGQVLTTQFTGPAEEAQARSAASGGGLVQIRSRDIPSTADAFVNALGRDTILRYSPEPHTPEDAPKVRLTGTCAALRALGEMASCPDRPRPLGEVFARLTPAGSAVLRSRENDLLSAPAGSVCACGAPVGGDAALYGFLVADHVDEAGLGRVKQAAYAHLIGPMTALPGQSWSLGAAAMAAQIRWLLDIVLIGLAALAAAGALGAAGIFLEQAKALGPLSAFRVDRRFYRAIATWNLALPLGTVGAVGVLVSMTLGGLLIHMGRGGWMSGALLLVGLGGVVLAGLVVALSCGRVAARQARVWRPRGD